MIYIAGDKNGYGAVRAIRKYLRQKELEFEDWGVSAEDEDMTLEVMIPSVVERVLAQESNTGILCCGTGIGVEVGANKFGSIRACLATSPKIAEWGIHYDKCNILCLPGWGVSEGEVFAILDAWFGARYDGDEDRLKMFETFKTWH